MTNKQDSVERIVEQLVENGRAKHDCLNSEQRAAADDEARAFYRKVVRFTLEQALASLKSDSLRVERLWEVLAELEAALADGLCNSGVPGFDPNRLERARASARAALQESGQ